MKKVISIIAAAVAAVTLAGCYSESCGSKTIVGNHYALPKISNDASNTDIEVYESTEGAVVYTRRDSKVGIHYQNAYTNLIFGIWNKSGIMALKVEIEPLDVSGDSSSTDSATSSSGLDQGASAPE